MLLLLHPFLLSTSTSSSFISSLTKVTTVSSLVTTFSTSLSPIKKDPLSNIGCTVGLPDHSDIYTWKCTLVGPEDSPYKGGIFQLYIKFKKNFPMEGPEVIFDTPIYHMNINPVAGNQPLGHCCVSTVNFWTPDTSIEDLLTSIFGLFYVAN